MSWSDCSYDNPRRAVDWRWQRALHCASSNEIPTTRLEDGPIGYKWIKRACFFKKAWDEAATDIQSHTLKNKIQDIWWAHDIWLDDKDPLRWDMEAHILGRGDNWEIGFACGVAPEIVEAYECLFFNVRDKLNHQKYILHQVIGPAVQRGLSERDFDVLWKLYAYFYGPHMLAAIASKTVNPVWCSTPDTVSASIQDDAIGTLKLKSAIAAKTIPVTYNTQADLLHIFTKFVEVERTTDSAGKAQDQILEHISAMMTNLPFNIGGRDPANQQQIGDNPVHVFKQSAIELSFGETMAVSVGHRLPHVEALQDMEFPPPPGIEDGDVT